MPSAAVARSIIAAAGASHTGLQRENNEDRFHCDPARGIFMVIDGVGGHAAGEKAAETALTIIRARLERETGQPADRVREAIALANNEIVRLGASEPSWAGMACVLTVALVRDGRVTVGHVGDTRLYSFREAGLAKVTHDHSPIGEREDQGEIDERAAMAHPRRNEIYRDVGSELHEPADAGFIELVEMPLEGDSALLLCTDGLSDMVPSARIAQILLEQAGDPAAAVERLIEAANHAGGKDNVTAVAVMGPGFAAAAPRRLRALAHAEGKPLAVRRVVAALSAALVSGPALVAYGAIGALVLLAALLPLSGPVADRVAEKVRPPGWGRTWRVGTGDAADFATIQQAFARARAGDVVVVEPGTYDLPEEVPMGVDLVSQRSREAVLRPAPHSLPGGGMFVTGGSRLAGFKIEATGGAGLVVRDGAGGEASTLEDLEIVDAAAAAVRFTRESRSVLQGSYLHDNGEVAVEVGREARPSLLHNVITANGKHPRGGAPSAPATAATEAPPAVLVTDGGAATFFGNIIAGNARDEIRGLPADKRADVLRDNVIGLPTAAKALPPAGKGNRR